MKAAFRKLRSKKDMRERGEKSNKCRLINAECSSSRIKKLDIKRNSQQCLEIYIFFARVEDIYNGSQKNSINSMDVRLEQHGFHYDIVPRKSCSHKSLSSANIILTSLFCGAQPMKSRERRRERVTFRKNCTAA